MFQHMIKGILVLIAIPIGSYLSSIWTLSKFNSDILDLDKTEFKSLLDAFATFDNSITDMCAFLNTTDANLGHCDIVYWIDLMQIVSISTGIIGVVLILIFFICAVIAGSNRKLNAALFPSLVPFTTFILSLLILSQGALATASLYIIQVYIFGFIYYFITGLVALGAVVGCFKLISSLVSIQKEIIHSEFALVLPKNKSPKLWKIVEDTAKQLNSNVPDNIILGLDLNFYATAAIVNLIGKNEQLKGETLFLSLPMMRILSADELKSIIGHELGHFKGNDTAYTLKFAPVYRGLSSSLITLSNSEQVLTIPAIAVLQVMLDIFSINEKKISRIREFEADNAGVSVSSPESMAYGLAKIATYGPLWDKVRRDNIDRLNQGKISANLSKIYEDSAIYDIEHNSLDKIISEILKVQIAHPTDSHPTISERYNNIKFDSKLITIKNLIKKGNSINLLENFSEYEESLTAIEHQFMIALGHVDLNKIKEGENETNHFLNCVYTLAALMVGADGKILQSEVKTAETIGKKLFEDFDNIDFRSCCDNYKDLPNFVNTLTILKDIINEEQKLGIYNYLKSVSEADGDIDETEIALLDLLIKNWGIKDKT